MKTTLEIFKTESGKTKELQKWLFCLLLLTPVFVLYIAHYASEPNPTGFIQYDMPYYMANAREYFDRGSFNLFYSNPFSSFVDSSRIYFQPHILLLAIVWKITALDPGVVYCFFGFFSGLICLRLALLVYETLFGLATLTDKLVFILFCWGGGVLFISGFTYQLFCGAGFSEALNQGFRFDPSGGFWMLSFGRNLVYPTEAYYHALYFGLIYCLLKKKLLPIAVLSLALSLSHPYTGLEIVSAALLYLLLERYYWREENSPVSLILGLAAILVVHITYYLGILNMDVEHHALYLQWSLPWTFRAENFVPAYILVAMLFLYRIRTPEKLGNVFQKRENRLFAILAFVAFLLANHEFAFSPKQPIHFTHGYVWIPIFLLGAGVLKEFFNNMRSRGAAGILVILAISFLFLIDNIMWFGLNSRLQYRGKKGIHYTDAQKDLFKWMNRREIDNRYLMLANDNMLGYLATVYTPARVFTSHWVNTPFISQKNKIKKIFLTKGIPHKILLGESLFIVEDKNNASGFFKNNGNFKCVFENSKYVVYISRKKAYAVEKLH
ncbi:MAG: hypothetical protein KAG97_03315 [Victivallales bacterium]|nr:hypothetical protein [Victivallales bacterium]